MKKIIRYFILFCIFTMIISQSVFHYNIQAEGEQENMVAYLDNLDSFPCSFKYNGNTYKGLSKSFTEISRNRESKNGNINTIIKLLHTESNAIFTLDALEYKGYGAFEWTISIENTGTANTGVFSEFNAADIYFKGGNPAVKGLSGDSPSYYMPYEINLLQRSVKHESTNGRPTHGVFPYYNLEHGDGGTFIAIGWPGCWKAEFVYENGSTHFKGGLSGFNAYLTPGEKVRMPLMAFVSYNGRDEQKAMNVWRKWFIDCNIRKFDGEPFKPAFAAMRMADGSSTDQLTYVSKLYEYNGIKLDYLWVDAGWYTDAEGNKVGWPQTGTLMIDTNRFPDKFKDLSKYLNDTTETKLLLWFEPEVIRVDKDSFLANIPDFKKEWMLGKAFVGTWLEGEVIDLGNPECVKWLFDRISTIIDEGGISMYRQDFNVDPGNVWRANDESNRNGITENGYCQGYLALWDAMIARFPDMMIDSCASGGGRNDLETLRRSVPLHITDLYDGNDNQYTMKNGMVQALFSWIPYFDCELSADPTMYRLRSNYAPWMSIFNNNISMKSFSWDLIRQSKKEWNQVKEYFYSDYYQLTPWNRSDSQWNGWQFFDPDKNSGYAQLMRPAGSSESEKVIKLHGLDPNSTYTLKDFDGLLSVTAKGKDLMDNGVSIKLPEAEYAMIVMVAGERGTIDPGSESPGGTDVKPPETSDGGLIMTFCLIATANIGLKKRKIFNR